MVKMGKTIKWWSWLKGDEIQIVNIREKESSKLWEWACKMVKYKLNAVIKKGWVCLSPQKLPKVGCGEAKYLTNSPESYATALGMKLKGLVFVFYKVHFITEY